VWNARTRSRQPQAQGAGINETNSVTRDLRALLYAGSLYDERTRAFASNSGTEIVATQANRARSFIASSSQYISKALPNPANARTLITLCKLSDISTAHRALISLGDSGSSNNDSTLYYEYTTNQFAFLERGGGSTAQILCAVSANTNNWFFVAGIRVSATERYCYVNGVLSSIETTSTTPASLNSLYVGVARYGGALASYHNGLIRLSAVVDRALSLRELHSLYRNPWQLFAPERRPKFFSVGSGANTYAVGISETATASETVSMLAAFGASISETATASETVAMRATFGTSISETATASETVSMAASFVVTIGETATASETVAMALGAATFAVDISETATASETVSMLAAFGTSISETATASDLVSMLATFLVGISETATASETVAMQLANQTYAVDISETATASDTVVMTIPTTYAISIIETVQAGDYVSMGVPSSDFWTQVTTTQSAGWGQINNTQSSGWTIIPTT